MKIDYRQGIISASPGFLKQSTNYKFVDIIVSQDPIILSFVDGDKDYLVNENASILNAWGPIENLLTYYLFWDINTKTGQLTRGMTVFPLIKSNEQPKFARKDQMWWHSLENKMYEYDGSSWKKVIRLFAGKIQARKTITEEPLSSQVNLNVESIAGYILFEDGLPLKNKNDEFLTSDVMLSSGEMAADINDDSIRLVANQDVQQFDIVSIKGGYASLASGIYSSDEALAPFGMVKVSASKGDLVSLFKAGELVENKAWAFSKDQLGLPVFCDAQGKITFTKLNKFKNTKVGTVISPESVLLCFDSDTDISDNIDTLHSFNLQELEDAKAKVLAFSSIVQQMQNEILRLQTLLDNKSQIVHRHKPEEVVGISDLMASKANLDHIHTTEQVSGLFSLLNEKAGVTHRHAMSQLEDTSNISYAQNGQVLSFNSAANKWQPTFIKPSVVYKEGQFYEVNESDSSLVIDYFSQLNARIELPNNLPPGFGVTFIQTGDGKLEFVSQPGSILRNKDGHAFTAAKWAVVTLIVRTNTAGINAEYVLSGDTSAA